ncbi:MAG: UDP-3-O-acyl-N-acetylglucosamine deacetylase [Alloprevotella sp.]|nr:UDP-3-O-acyl-N-acetylglucosamine deacetylase [Alloprevotella sp.]
MKQKTLRQAFSLYGKGLHTGLNLTVTFRPAEEGYGYKIRRTDLPGQPVIDAVAENVVDTSRGTVVAVGDARCSTIEHAMAALYSQGIDNCHIDVDGPEFPILDGSSRFFLENILIAGTQEQAAEKDVLVVDRPTEYCDEAGGSRLLIEPASEFSVQATIAFESEFISSQTAELRSLADFPADFAAARTFVFVREIEPLLQLGLIKGGDLDNAIVIYERQVPQERLDQLADALHVPHKDATKLGYINRRPLEWPNEPARHKLLDIIGDMALIGRPLQGRITAMRPGHTANNRFARLLRREYADK